MGTRQLSSQHFRQTQTRIRALQAQWKWMSSLTKPELDLLLTATIRELYPCPCASNQSNLCQFDPDPMRHFYQALDS